MYSTSTGDQPPMTEPLTFTLPGGHRLDVAEGRAWARRQPLGSIHTMIFSPPYWMPRQYGKPGETATVWGGDQVLCEHAWSAESRTSSRTYPAGAKDRWIHEPTSVGLGRQRTAPTSARCERCGAWYGELGQEPTPFEYADHLAEFLEPFIPLLRRDGSLWIVIGDTWTSSGRGSKAGAATNCQRRTANAGAYPPRVDGKALYAAMGLSEGEQVGVPWLVVWALRRLGCILRIEDIWAKNNGVPESVTDRCTRSHESVLHFALSDRPQFWTHPRKRGCRRRPKGDNAWIHRTTGETLEHGAEPPATGRLRRRLWLRRNLWEGHKTWYDADAVAEPCSPNTHPRGKANRDRPPAPKYRNRRSVWKLSTKGYPGGHFATFPEELVRIPLLAACPPKVCSSCGAPWAAARVRGGQYQRRWGRGNADGSPYNRQGSDQVLWKRTAERPTCSCGAPPTAGTVCDPFAGAGTMMIVADREGRRFVGCEAVAAYVDQAVERLRKDRRKRGIVDPPEHANCRTTRAPAEAALPAAAG